MTRDDPEADLRGQPPALDIDLDAPLYTAKDAQQSLQHFAGTGYGDEVEVAPGVHATFFDAGHILGSAIIRLRVQDGPADPERIIVFSGDLGRPGTPILRDPTAMTDADYVLVESTYGGREHEPEDEAIRILAETVRLVADAKACYSCRRSRSGGPRRSSGSSTVSSSAARSRSCRCISTRPWPPKRPTSTATTPTTTTRRRAKLLREGDTPLDYPNQTITNDAKASRAIERAPRPYMIVASNGMLTGGRVVGHLRNLDRRSPRDDPVRRLPGRRDARRPPAGRCHGRSGSTVRPAPSGARFDRSAASPPTPTSPSSSTGFAGSPTASTPAIPDIPARCSSSTATRRRRPRSNHEVRELGLVDPRSPLARARHPRLTA